MQAKTIADFAKIHFNIIKYIKIKTKERNKNMKKLENRVHEQGITLVALVITIVIIIILATITINMALGDNGLIKQAEDARDMAANDTSYTEDSLTNVSSYLNELLAGTDTSNAKTLVQAFKDGEIEAGDYVNYKPSEVKSVTVGTDKTGYTNSNSMSDGTDQTFTTDMNTTWQVLGLSEDGQHLLLTSGSPIKKDGEDPYLVLQGAEGHLYCVDTLDEIAGIYHNSTLAEKTRSITIKDIENVLGGVTVEYPTEGNPNTGTIYFNADASRNTEIGQVTNYPSYTYQSDDYSLESAIQDPPQNATAGAKVDADAYMFRYDYSAYQELGIDISQKAYNMLFAGTTNEENNAKSYWLASPGVHAGSSSTDFGPGIVIVGFVRSGGYYGLFVSDGGWRAVGFAVRPVVVLKSNINVNQLQVIADQTEEVWSTYGRTNIWLRFYSGINQNYGDGVGFGSIGT